MTDLKRRALLKGSFAVGSVGVAVGAGLLNPDQALADWNAAAFQARDVPTALTQLLGSETAEISSRIKIKVPDIAENGAVVPVAVETDLPGVTSISIIAANNPIPLVASFDLAESAVPFVTTRIKMAKTSDVIAVVRAGGRLYKNAQNVKVMVGGC